MCESVNGWHSGISSLVFFAAMIPASRAACSGSPFLTLPERINLRALPDMAIDPRATASRSVTGLSPTSTMRMRPLASTWVNLAFVIDSLSEIERQAFERHGQIDALHLDARWNFERAGRKIQDRLDPGVDRLIEHLLCRVGRHGDERDVDLLAPDNLLQLLQIMNGYAALRFVADLGLGDVEHGDNLEAFALESRIVGERQAKVAGAHDGHAQLAIKAEDLAQVPLEILDVIANAPHAEFAEIRKVLADLRRVEMELFGQRLR